VTDIDDRLQRCFSSVFPGLTSAEIGQASPETVASWDSLKSVTLIAVVQEAFGVDIDPLDWPDLVSFAAFHAYLGRPAA
jgi:acyl carrier protein